MSVLDMVSNSKLTAEEAKRFRAEAKRRADMAPPGPAKEFWLEYARRCG